MRQIATLLRKDFERLWPLCLIAIALIGFHLYGVTRLASNTGIVVGGGSSIFLLIAELSNILLPVALVVAIAFVIQQESLVGSDAFWLTRPYWRTALLTEKALFVAFVALIPMIVHDFIAVRWFGMASLGAAPVIVVEGLELAGLLVCGAAFAVLTPGFARFTLLVLGCTVAFVVAVMATNNSGAGNWGPLSGIPSVLAWSVATIGATTVILYQYRTRRVIISGIIGAASLMIAVLILSYFPWTAAWHLKQWFGIPATSLADVQLIPTQDASDTILSYSPANFNRNLPYREILYPFRINNLPNDISLEAFRCRTEIESASAPPPLVVSPNILFRHRPPLSQDLSSSREKQFMALGILPSRIFYRLRDSKVTLEGTMYFESYRDLKPIRVPLSGGEASIQFDRERCTFRSFPSIDQNGEKQLVVLLNCVELEPAVGIHMDVSLVDAAGKPIWRQGAGFSGMLGPQEMLPSLFNPVHQSNLQFPFTHQPGAEPPSIPEGSSFVISARKPTGMLRRDFRIEDVRLGDLEWTGWKQRGTKNYPASITR
jgi:hypothetical protein